MSYSLLKTLSMAKYSRLLPRVFPACELLEVRDIDGSLIWQWHRGDTEAEVEADGDEVVAWADFGRGIERRTMPDGRTQFRGPLAARDKGTIGWLIVGYDTTISVPMDTAPEPLRRGFGTFVHKALRQKDRFGHFAVLAAPCASMNQLGAFVPIVRHRGVPRVKKPPPHERRGRQTSLTSLAE